MNVFAKAIKEKCIECNCGVKGEVKKCKVEACPLFPYRVGKDPNKKPRNMSEKQKELIAMRLKESRLKGK